MHVWITILNVLLDTKCTFSERYSLEGVKRLSKHAIIRSKNVCNDEKFESSGVGVNEGVFDSLYYWHG